MKSLCVFCGSSPGTQPDYLAAAAELGALLSAQGITLVYGGGNVGIMGTLADAVLDAGGKVTGVIPRSMVEKGVGYTSLKDLIIVETMHQRKACMAELADGFIALPGGFGTIEEIFEVITWSQLGYHHKPCGLLNICGYYDHIIQFLEHAVQQQFIEAAHLAMILVDTSPAALLKRFEEYQPPTADKFSSALLHTREAQRRKTA